MHGKAARVAESETEVVRMKCE